MPRNVGEEYDLSFPIDDELVAAEMSLPGGGLGLSAVARRASPAKTSKRPPASKDGLGHGGDKGGHAVAAEALPSIGKIKTLPKPGKSPASGKARLGREKIAPRSAPCAATNSSAPAEESEDAYVDDFCCDHPDQVRVNALTNPTVESSVGSLPRVASTGVEPTAFQSMASGGRVADNRGNLRRSHRKASPSNLRPSTRERYKAKVGMRNIIVNERQKVRESTVASGPKMSVAHFSLSAPQVVASIGDGNNDDAPRPGKSDLSAQLQLIQHHCSSAKLRYLELLACVRIMDLSRPSRHQYRAALDVYNALSTLLYTCLSSNSMSELQMFIRQASVQLPSSLFDYAEWGPVIDMATSFVNKPSGGSGDGGCGSPEGAGALVQPPAAGSSYSTAGAAAKAARLRAKAGELRSSVHSLKREFARDVAGLFSELSGRLHSYAQDQRRTRQESAAAVAVELQSSKPAATATVAAVNSSDVDVERRRWRDEHAAAMASLRAAHADEVGELKGSLAEMVQRHADAIARLEQESSDNRASHRVEIDRIREGADKKYLEMVDKMSKAAGGDSGVEDGVVASYERELSVLRGQLREGSEALRAATSSHLADRDALAAALADATRGLASASGAARAAEEQSTRVQSDFAAYRADKEAAIEQLSARVSELTKSAAAQSSESSGLVQSLQQSLAQLQLQQSRESPVSAAEQSHVAPQPDLRPLLEEKELVIEALRKQVADAQRQLKQLVDAAPVPGPNPILKAALAQGGSGDDLNANTAPQKRRGSDAASPRPRVDSTFLRAYGGTKQGDSGWYLENSSLLFYFCLDDRGNYNLLCGPISIAMYKHACDEVQAIANVANKAFEGAHFTIDSTCLVATRLQIDQLIEENALHLQALIDKGSRNGSRKNSFSFSLSSSRKNSISSQHDLSMIQQLSAPSAEDRLEEQKQHYEGLLLRLQKDLADMQTRLRLSSEKLRALSGKQGHVYALSTKTSSTLSSGKELHSEKRLHRAVVGVQSAYRGYVSRRDFYKNLRRHVARCNNMLVALGGTVQGTTGWYHSADGAVFYFGLEGGAPAADDHWKVLAGPISLDVYRSLSLQAKQANVHRGRRKSSANELTAIKVVNDIALASEIRGHVYLDINTEKLLIISHLN